LEVFLKGSVRFGFIGPGRTLLELKDAKFIFEATDIVRVPLPSGNACRDRLLGAIAHGEGDKDWAVMARAQGSACGLE
jgi:3-hydroxyisobutyrate dehydrogenase-like beta-hydroxyacid dehydrogenase